VSAPGFAPGTTAGNPRPGRFADFPEVLMSVHAALVRPVFGTPRGRHAKARAAWPRVAVRTLFLLCAVLSAGAVAGAGWPPVLLVVPAAALVLLVAGVVKLRTAARKIDSIFAEELTREMPAEIREGIEIS
jgi:hypothetical protein